MTPDTLTRAEAADRAALISGVSYEVDLDLTTGDETFALRSRIGFGAAREGASSFLDLLARRVVRAELNGELLPPESFDGRRLALPELKTHNELVLQAECEYTHVGQGLHFFRDPVDEKVYLHTQFEPFDAHRMFACFDQPDIKGTFALSVTAPVGWECISNGVVAEQDGGRWRFETTPPISTYIAALVAGPFHAVRDRHGLVALGLYCRQSLAQHLDADEIFEVTKQGLDFFESVYGYPYPFGKYDQLFCPEFNFGAMENAGCVTFNEAYVFRSKRTEAMLEGRANTILHEMAHMWFGDLVTMKWWDDLWLNESFATYMATDAIVRATRFPGGWTLFAFGTKTNAYAEDQLPTTHPISADIVDTEALRLHFDGITYSKGASVLRQLVAWVGEQPFESGIRDYFRRHEWANATLADFLDALERSSGRDLSAWSKEWLETAGVNTLRAHTEVADGRYTSVAIEQEAAASHPTLRSHRVALGLYDEGPNGLERRRRVELDVTGAGTEVPELAGETVPALLLVNDDDLAYAKIRLDDQSVRTVSWRLHAIADPLARALCWAATWDMVRDAELRTRSFIELVGEHAHHESEIAVVGRLLAQADSAIDAYGAPANRRPARALLASRTRAEMLAAAPESDAQLVWARGYISFADAQEDLAFLRALLDGSEEVRGLAVDTDLRWQIIGALAVAGAADDDLIEAERKRDATDIGARRALAARTSRPRAEDRAEAWRMANDERTLSVATIRAIVSSFYQPEQDEILRPYVQRYFESLARWWSERDPEEALVLTRLFPSTLIEQSVADAATRALEAGGDLPTPVRRILLEGRDRIERALRARAADAS